MVEVNNKADDVVEDAEDKIITDAKIYDP